MELYSLRINGLKEPLGFSLPEPSLSWKVKNAAGKKQLSAKVTVTDGKSVLFASKGELDSVGTTIKADYAPRTRYFVSVTVTSDAGETASAETYFETGSAAVWTAPFIGCEADGVYHPEYFTRFDCAKQVASARLYIMGLGVFKAEINGKPVSDEMLAPFMNDYEHHFELCTYDVTGLLESKNTLSVELGNGWYRGRFVGGPRYERPYALTAEVAITYKDGTVESIKTGEKWSVRRAKTVASDIYDGEARDFTLAEETAAPARVITAPGALIDRYSPRLVPQETIKPVKLINTPAGETVLDFGQNMAGIVTVDTDESFKLEFGEILAGGNFYHDNYRSAKSEFSVISDGVRRVHAPAFTYFGFRYVKVTGMSKVDPEAFTARAVYSEIERTGVLHTGNPKIDRLVMNALWGARSNFVDMPTDCPQRDERMGWCGDAQVFAPTACYLFDMKAFYDKFLQDLRTYQLRYNGVVPVSLPQNYPGLGCAAWSDIGTILPTLLYMDYGDKSQLMRHYPLMREWVEWLRRKDVEKGDRYLWEGDFQFGDWLALDGPTDDSDFGRTDSDYLASCFYYMSAHMTGDAARILGYNEDADKYVELAENIKQAILHEFFSPAGRLTVDTQTGYLLALKNGIYIDKEVIRKALRKRLKDDLWRIKCGFVGATMICDVLAENGMEQTAYDLLFYEGFPGWLYAVNMGATTIWERWNSVQPDGSLSSSGMNSLNHYSFGSVVGFIFRHAAGITPLEPAFRRVRIAPKIDTRLGSVACRFESPVGEIVSEWDIGENGEGIYHISVPFGCEAVVALPGRAEMTLTAGDYNITVADGPDLLCPYNAETPMERIIKDENAVAALGPVMKRVKVKDPIARSRSLNFMRNENFFLRVSKENYDNAEAALKKVRVKKG